MAKMSIDMYRGLLRNAKQLIVKHQHFINGTTVDNLNLPMLFYEDIQADISEINQYIGELDIAIKTLPVDSSEKYRKVSQELKQIDIRLKEIEKSFITGQV